MKKKIAYLFRFFRQIRILRLIAVTILLLPIYFILYKIYIPKINAFGCFDDCHNFVTGYFLQQGKTLYSETYTNHQPLIAYISYFIQNYAHPINIYDLVLAHRRNLMIFSFLFQVFLCWRFGIISFVSMIIYEFTKFYVFGDRFLAEGYIVYPLTYLIGLALHTIKKRHVLPIEVIFASMCTWFVVYMREPYIPLALFLFFLIIRKKILSSLGHLSLLIFIALSIYTFSLFPFQDYFYNVFYLNFSRILVPHASSGSHFWLDIVKSFSYPLVIFFIGLRNDFRIVLLNLSFLFILSLTKIIRSGNNFIFAVLLILVLGLANLQPSIPGLKYYEAFHGLIWYGLYIFSTIYISYEMLFQGRNRYLFFLASTALILYVCFSPQSFIYQKTDSHTEFISNYGHYIGIGETIKSLSKPTQTMFTDGNEELLYWQAKRPSSYPYSIYYPAEKTSKYYQARLLMFSKNPPDVYYDFCTPIAPDNPSMPQEALHTYTQLLVNGNPSCLYVKTSLIPHITQSQWMKAKEFGYSL